MKEFLGSSMLMMILLFSLPVIVIVHKIVHGVRNRRYRQQESRHYQSSVEENFTVYGTQPNKGHYDGGRFTTGSGHRRSWSQDVADNLENNLAFEDLPAPDEQVTKDPSPTCKKKTLGPRRSRIHRPWK
jgi:hypothetical protein